MSEPRWLFRIVILQIHSEQIAEHSGKAGIRDEGLLESALGRAEMKAHCGENDLALLAAAYAFGISRKRPFLDGNKRTAFVAMGLFLAKNGFVLTATDQDSVPTFLNLAAGDVSEKELTMWVRHHMEPGQP
jgi:death-on-curing protein